MFPLPPYRNKPLLALSVVILVWVILTAWGFHFMIRLHDPRIATEVVWIAIPTAVLSIGTAGGFLVRSEVRAVRERQARIAEVRPPMEVIPIEKPPQELQPSRKNRRQVVVTVSRRRVRALPPPCPIVMRRKALGLATNRTALANRRRKN